MDRGFRILCQGETRRLLTLLGVTAILVLVVQYAELPYGKMLSLIPSIRKISNSQMETSLGYSEREGNNNRSNANSINAFEAMASSPAPEAYEGRSSGFENAGGSIMAPGSGLASETKNFTANGVSSPVNNIEFTTRGIESPSFAPSRAPLGSETESRSPTISVPSNATSVKSDAAKQANNNDKPGFSQGNSSMSRKDNRITAKTSNKRPSEVVSISEMNLMLQRSHASSKLVASGVDQQIVQARLEIENAPIIENDSRFNSPIYRNASIFKRSYELMEKMLKVYIYQDGDKPIFHEYLLDGIYASEGWFMKLMEANKQFVTQDPGKAHLFYIPFSSRLLQLTLYVRNSHRRSNLIEYMRNYVDMIAAKHPFWNRKNGTDHFVVACHDWAPAETRGRMLNCIRALCNADIEVGFKIGKDVSLPETYVISAQNPLKNIGGNHPSQRPILAFFAGGMHGYLRPILLKYWQNKEADMQISGPLPHVRGNANYLQLMKNSKYCICARGHEVNSPRVVEAIINECVPVVLSDNFVPPFFEVLNWESFAVIVTEKDIPNLRNILLSISEERYLEMYRRVKQVQEHFLWRAEPVRYDLFHMILHSIWYNRLFQTRH
ncbi:probable glycosyltransferase At5g03795 isoform X2 [Neltuma alba]|uniref:probable glycosyltransferase At5g03795 isoform X2 n=1 Tax=Neltuma alba TaxID=207710 RepID=UPI0010A50766|nr:probable glycosyltransferase At5g03795 isoform X2 [Prosopis alba]